MVRAGNLDDAMKLFYDRLNITLFYHFGAYQLIVELLRALFLDGEDKPPRLTRDDYQAVAFNFLANAYALSGQPNRAVPLYDGYIAVSEKRNDKKETSIGLGAKASVTLLLIGALSAAERDLYRSIELCREIADEFDEAIGHLELGKVLSYRGVWQEAEQKLDIALKLFNNPRNDVRAHWMGLTHSYFAIRLILMTRSKQNQSLSQDIIKQISEAITFMEEFSKTNYPIKREYVRNFGLLGAVYRMNHELTLAEENLSKALNLCRQINLVSEEANILLDLARLSFDYGLVSSAKDRLKYFEQAKSLADEALLITERCAYVLQGADVNLFLAQYALEQEKDRVKAKEYAETALKLAYCDGPPYYYKVAYHEAERFLENLK
jgi:tetratricopeptide (TPR) repeat protein